MTGYILQKLVHVKIYLIKKIKNKLNCPFSKLQQSMQDEYTSIDGKMRLVVMRIISFI